MLWRRLKVYRAQHYCHVELLVEDHLDTRELMRTFLQMRGHFVHAACDGEEALKALGTFVPDVVLLDICLPGMDGYAVCARMRGMLLTKDVTIVALTATSHPETAGKVSGARFDMYLTKPVALDIIDSLLSSARVATQHRSQRAGGRWLAAGPLNPPDPTGVDTWGSNALCAPPSSELTQPAFQHVTEFTKDGGGPRSPRSVTS